MKTKTRKRTMNLKSRRLAVHRKRHFTSSSMKMMKKKNKQNRKSQQKLILRSHLHLLNSHLAL